VIFDSGSVSSTDAGSLTDAGLLLESGVPAADAGPSSDSDGGPFSFFDGGSSIPLDCQDVLRLGGLADGFYVIDPDGVGAEPPFPTYCLQSMNGGGWTVITNNHNGDNEPSGCLPRIASTGLEFFIR
jgi:hypothetical protein